mgnify:CR=1 FL=1
MKHFVSSRSKYTIYKPISFYAVRSVMCRVVKLYYKLRP